MTLPYKEAFKILKNLSIESVEKDMRTMERDIMRSFDDDRVEGHAHPASAIFLHTALGVLEESSFDVVYERLSWIPALDHAQSVNSLTAKADKVAILWLQSGFTGWLDRMLADAEVVARGITEDAYSIPEWLINLTRRAHRMVESRDAKVAFNTSDFNIIMKETTQTCEVKRTYEYFRDEETIISTTLGIVLEIICAWTGMHTPQERWRMWLLDTMINCLGHDIIFLNGTWDIIQNATKLMIFKTYTPKILVKRSYFIPFEDALMDLANTTEWEDCMLYAENIRIMLRKVFEDPELAGFSSMIPYTLPRLCNMESIEDPKNHKQKRRGVQFLNFIRQALAIVCEEVKNNKATNLQLFIMSDMSKNCPFRDCTPDFARMSGCDGPYFRDRIKTEGGIFSAILWRGVTLRTKFSQVERAVFLDYADWDDTLKAMPKTGSYVCNANVHGTATQRNPKHAFKYWQSVLKLKWPDFCQESHTFQEFYDLFHPNHPDQPFEHLGPLGTLQLLGDLVQCGVAPLPSNVDIGRCMKLINSGSVKGAAYLLGDMDVDQLGWTKKNAEYCSRGAQHAFNILRDNLTHEEKEFINVSYCMVEHALCKFWIAVNKGLIE
jgi:hypothetical protein